MTVKEKCFQISYSRANQNIGWGQFIYFFRFSSHGRSRPSDKAGARSSRPWDKESGGHKKIFRPFGPQFGLKIRGGPPLVSLTVVSPNAPHDIKKRLPGRLPLPWIPHCFVRECTRMWALCKAARRLSRDFFQWGKPTGFLHLHTWDVILQKRLGKSSGYKSRDTHPYKLGCVKELQEGKKAHFWFTCVAQKRCKKFPDNNPSRALSFSCLARFARWTEKKEWLLVI